MIALRPLAAVASAGLALAIGAVSPAANASAPQSFTADYSVTFLGLPVASATFTSSFSDDGAVAVRGSLRSAGLVRIFDQTQGSTSLTARLGSNGVEPHSFVADYVSGRRQQKVTVRFSSGEVAATNYEPAPRPRRPDWVPVTGGHLGSVLDPLSATLVRARSADEVCGRTVSVYDGWMRADLRLEPVSTGPVSGHDGIGAVCSGRFVPIAGYNANSRDIHHIRDRGNIRITFAPLGDTGVYAPVQASVGTRVGTVSITASAIRSN